MRYDATSAPAIEATGLVKRFGETTALAGVDMVARQGRVLGVLGPNGAGKTTAVRILATLLRPDGGQASVCGYDVLRNAYQVRQLIGLTGQYASVDEGLSGTNNLIMIGRLLGLPRGQARARAAELLTRFELTEAAGRIVKTYSGGMRRRLDLAAALVHRPKVVFLDEPTTGLDPISREAIWRYVLELNRAEGVTFFLTTQYLEEADRLAHDVAIMDAGRIVARGSPEELKSSIGTDVVTLRIEGGPDELARAERAVRRLEGVHDVRTIDDAVIVYVREGSSAIARLVLLLNEASVTAREVTLARPTLDDVFLRKTGHHLEAEERAAEAAPARGRRP